ncbi:MAG TPA: FtsW/RodA/SpoVE family cell cycle protein, partial [Terriglobia bacterium]|nr:FtsW/RodA/SpoVE family cell cycle protein [Terriglobia bacterium]
MENRLAPDRVLFFAAMALVVFGLLMVYSASAPIATEQSENPAGIFLRQALWALLGLGAMLFLMRFDYRKLAHPAILFPGIFCALLLLVAVLFTAPVQQTNR